MVNLRNTAVIFGSVVFALCSPSQGWADGGFFVETTASTTQIEAISQGLINSDGQRAVIWQTSADCWDLFVEPGEVKLSNAAWIIPMPVIPVIGEGSANFIDQLDAATTPVFSTQRQYLEFEGNDGWGCGCGGAVDSAAGVPIDQREGVEASPVEVWGQGRLGGLSYEIVSTRDASALQTWLTDNSYTVPDTLAARIEPYVEDSFFFFVAKVEREADDASQVAVARFTLCDAPQLWYPMRLTSYSTAGALDFTVWVIADDSLYAPSNAAWYPASDFYEEVTTVYGQEEYDLLRDEIEKPFPELYDENLASLLEIGGGRSMAVQYAGEIVSSNLSERLAMLEEAGVDLPLTLPLTNDRSDWSSELTEIVDNNLLLTRWHGSFPAAAMEYDDLTFDSNDHVAYDHAMYSRTIEYYSVEPPASSSDDAGDSGVDALGASNRHPGHRRLSAVGLFTSRPIPKGLSWPLALIALASLVWIRSRTRRVS